MDKIRQRRGHDCGVACLAMLTGVAYEVAEEAFNNVGLNLVRGRKKEFASNFKELTAAASELGKDLAMRPFKSWASIQDAAIVKVLPRRSCDWHWVVAVRRNNGIEILDPATDLPSFEVEPWDIEFLDFGSYAPAGNILQLA